MKFRLTLGLLVLYLGLVCSAQETLTLTTPATQTIAASWRVAALNIDTDAPNIEVTLKSDRGQQFVWRYVVGENGPTASEIQNAIRFINRGDFKPKTLNQWILEQIVAKKVKLGTVGGTPQ